MSTTRMPASAFRVDTHHHILPPSYLAEERERVLEMVGRRPRACSTGRPSGRSRRWTGTM